MLPSRKWEGYDAEHDIEPMDRAQRSFEGELCGFEDCLVPPEQICPACKLWYCFIHFPYHFERYPDHRFGVCTREPLEGNE